MTQKQLWKMSGDIDPVFAQGIIKSIKEIDSRFRNIPTSLIMGVIAAESSFRREVISSAGAVGLMQVKPSTYEWLIGLYPDLPWQKNGLTNPIENILAGMAFMYWIRLDKDLDFFAQIQAYNTGVGGYKRGSRAKDYATKVMIYSFAFIV